MSKCCFTLLFCLTQLQVGAQNTNDTFSIYFDLNIPTLNKKSESKIDSLFYYDKIIPGNKLLIIGYADYLGSEGYNQELSESRANNLAAYLIEYNIGKEDIQLCVGKGEIRRKKIKGLLGYPYDRRVDIVVLKEKEAIKNHKSSLSNKHTQKKNTHPITGTIKNSTIKTNTIDIKQYKTGESFVLKNLYFLPMRHTIRDESLLELENLLDVMNDNPNLKIQIEGHICCVKAAPDALDIDNGEIQLSVNRAEEVYNYLVSKGVEPERLKFVGYGRSRPVVSKELTEEDANKNRRVEIRILQK